MSSADQPAKSGGEELLAPAVCAELLTCLDESVAIYDSTWRCVYANDRAARAFGVPREEISVRPVWEWCSFARESLYREKLEQAAREKTRTHFEFQDPKCLRWFEIQIYPLGEGVAVVSRDITERKRAADQMDRQQMDLALALRAGEMGTWEWNLETGAVKWSEEIFHLLGYSKGSVAPSYEAWLQRLHPDDRSRVIADYERERDQEHAAEYRVIWPDGSEHWLHARGRHLRGLDGEGYAVAGVLFDVTESKHAAATAERMEQIYRAVGESIDYGIWVCDPEGRNIYASDSFLKLVGMTQEECSEFGWGSLLHPDEASATIAAWKECARNGESWEREHRFRGVDGQWHYILARGVPIRDEKGRVECWAGINLGIGAWKESQKAIQAKEELNRRIIESSRDWLNVLDLEGKVLWINEKGSELLHWPNGERVIEGKWIELWGEESREAADRAVAAAAAGRNASFVGELVVGGEVRRWDVRVTPILDPEGKPKEALAVARDITESHAAERALRESEERLRLAMEAGAIGTWDWDIPADRVAWTERTYELHGLKPGEFGGTAADFVELIHPEDRSRVQEAIAAALQGSAPYSIELRVIHPNGTVRWLTTSAKVLFDSQNRPLRMIGATADVTERKNAERDLQAAKDRLAEHADLLEQQVALRTSHLRQTVQSLEGVAYTMAHDLRAPLRTVAGFAQIVQEDYSEALGPAGQRYLEGITTSAKRMDALINDLLAFAKLSHADLPLEDFALEDKVERVRAELEGELRARNAVVRIRGPLGSVRANRTVLRQVITNLLSNAIKFVDPGIQPQVEIWAEANEGRVRVYVQDNGIGISPDHQEKIFELFQRLHDQSTYPGTGVGLAIVRKAMERMGGSVGLQSVPGKGSRFWIELPRQSSDGEGSTGAIEESRP